MSPKKRILLIDDEPSVTRMIKLRLESTGLYELQTVNRSTQGVAAALEFKPHLILLDVIMPERGGMAIAYDIKAEEALKDVPIVLLTALVSQAQARHQGGRFGGYPVLPKPSTTKDIIRCIEQQLSVET